MKMLVFVAVLTAAAAPLWAAGMEAVIAPPAVPTPAGETFQFCVYLHNTGSRALRAELPPRVTCILSQPETRRRASAELTSRFPKNGSLLEKGAFLKGCYVLKLPLGLEGPVEMTVADFSAAPVAVAVTAPDAFGKPAPRSLPEEALEGYAGLDELFTLYQPYLANIAAYEPMYFLMGADPADSKFQVSFKYRFFGPQNTLARTHPWVQGLHLAYTQTSYWDLQSASKPFEDTSYKPELFFLSANLDARPEWMTGFFLKSGFRHESNGRGGTFSRSTNFFYAEPIFILYDADSGYGMSLAPEIWTYVMNEDENNADLKDYRGYFDLDLKIGKADGFVLGSNFRWAGQGASIALDLTYPLHRLFAGNLNLYLQIQYVNALAESLINYRERSDVLRFGFSIVR